MHGAETRIENRALKRKKLAEASLHSLLSAVLRNPCYLHGVPAQDFIKPMLSAWCLDLNRPHCIQAWTE